MFDIILAELSILSKRNINSQTVVRSNKKMGQAPDEFAIFSHIHAQKRWRRPFSTNSKLGAGMSWFVVGSAAFADGEGVGGG